MRCPIRLQEPPDVTDAYLLGLALANQMRFVTFDAHVSLAVLGGATAGDLVVL